MSNLNDPELLADLRKHAVDGGTFEMYVGDGWLRLVRECHEAVVRRFPDYELHAVKEKYAELAFQAFPGPRENYPGGSWPLAEMAAVDELTDLFRERSATICEACGSPGEWRDHNGHEVTLCGRCSARVNESS
ncbi:hypothetical protein DSM112329_02886 [Paraconexibacter sp. AEG42_29]|uniref:Uncharacterized protein n=1 Tax=Paraconexibacter sp. AEG42_29 TaxID=2997339 RepID=A0AAU7AX24_9ACTN